MEISARISGIIDLSLELFSSHYRFLKLESFTTLPLPSPKPQSRLRHHAGTETRRPAFSRPAGNF